LIGVAAMLIDHDFEWEEERKEALLIDHDFEWEEEQEEALQTAAAAPAEGLPRRTSAPELLSSSEPIVGFVIRNRRSGFSYRTLALAIVALLSSVAWRHYKPYRSIAEPVIPRSSIPLNPRSLHQANPGRRPGDGVPRESEAGREDRSGRERPPANDPHARRARGKASSS
jgi:hypothetical protein